MICLKIIGAATGLLGFLALIFPALYAAYYGDLWLKLVGLERARETQAYRDTLQRLQQKRNEWKPWHGKLLWLGVFLTILSYIAGLIIAIADSWV